MIGELAALAGALVWAVVSIMIKDPIFKLGPVVVNTIRTWVGAFVFAIALVVTGQVGQIFTLPSYTVFALIVSIIVGLGVGDTLYFLSLRLIGVSRALPISGCYPLPTMIIAAFWLGEPITTLDVLGTVLIVSSVYILSISTAENARQPGLDEKIQSRDRKLGIIYAVLAALLWAGSTVLLKSGIAETNVIVANALRLPAAGLVLLLMGTRQKGGLRLKSADPKSLGVVIFSGVFGTALGSFLYLIAVVNAGAAKASALNSVSPFFAAPLAFIFLGEKPSRATIMGTLLSVGGVWLLMS